MKTFLAAAVIASIAATTHAEIVSMERKGVGTSNTEVTQIAEGHLVMVTDSIYEGFSGSDDMMGTSKGSCHGTMHLMAGKLSGGGHCVYTDSEGDNWVVNWVPNAMTQTGAVEGNWTITGGSGKYEGAIGTGSFSTLTDQATGKFVNQTTGSATLQ